ncbi:ATP-grasp ribosomal peptide maturase [Streptomyces uncialis]|uniref:ATP-grasp ribosomal peptide maturase n=1 Tax=Streptomyces uncialis TaxID=1048205 RepID=UPI0038013382
MTVLVLTRPDMDATADLVIAELTDRGVPVHRADPGDLPESAEFSARLGAGEMDWSGTWRGRHRGLRLGDVSGVYYRRPSSFALHPELSDADARWAFDEARAGFGGVLASLRCTWVNPPHNNAVADCPPVALAAAQRSGLQVPRTLITNRADDARAFILSQPQQAAAYKPLGAAGPSGAGGEPVAVWTSKVSADEITDGVARTAHLFQEWIDKEYEVRLTAVGSEMFAAEIHAGSPASRIDFRRDYDSLTYRVRSVPGHIACGVRSLMDALGLRYVALDFLVGQGTGDWYLIDVNPGGQFGFVPELRAPITQALADVLEGKQ